VFFNSIAFPTGGAFAAFENLALTSPDCAGIPGLFGNGAGNGTTFDFAGFGCNAVTSFSITASNFLFDTADPAAFPLQVFFSAGSASVQMTPVNVQSPIPEPGTLAMALAGAAGLALLRKRR
jgi:hypothetical protein